MKYAIIAVTPGGAELADRLGRKLAQPCDVFVKQGRHNLGGSASEYIQLKDCVRQIFCRYDALIFIAAAGIAVRMIAPHIVHKASDPAVIVLDERAQHVISLLAGHIGGANQLTREIAALLQADPVITTATDVNGKLAADVLAEEIGLRLYPLPNLKKINAAIVAGTAVTVYLDAALKNRKFYQQEFAKRHMQTEHIALAKTIDFSGPCIVVTDKKTTPANDAVLVLQPRRLAVGIGCRRHTTKEEIVAAIDAACQKIGRTRADIAVLASTVAKEGEAGLLAAAAELQLPIRFYENPQLQQMIDRFGLTASEFVCRQIGVGNVCEAAALYAAKTNKVILPKEKFKKVTVAIAWEK